MNYCDLYREDLVILGSPASDAGSVLAALAATLIDGDAGLAGRESEVQAALEVREAKGSTGSHGVAIPHVKLPGVDAVRVAILVNPEGVDFRALDGDPVRVFFGVIRPEEKAEEHLGLLRWIASVAQHPDFLSFACQADSPAQVLELLHELTPA